MPVKKDKEPKTKRRRCKHSYPDCFSGGDKMLWKCIRESGVEREVTNKDCDSCPHFKSRYIEYPIQVSGTELGKIDYDSAQCGRYVKIRPCAEQYEEKTYLGVYLGRLPLFLSGSYNRATEVYSVSACGNPAIFVPELGRIIFGCESWWRMIEKESDLEEIKDMDIENVWYVKALKELQKEAKQGD